MRDFPLKSFAVYVVKVFEACSNFSYVSHLDLWAEDDCGPIYTLLYTLIQVFGCGRFTEANKFIIKHQDLWEAFSRPCIMF